MHGALKKSPKFAPSEVFATFDALLWRLLHLPEKYSTGIMKDNLENLGNYLHFMSYFFSHISYFMRYTTFNIYHTANFEPMHAMMRIHIILN